MVVAVSVMAYKRKLRGSNTNTLAMFLSASAAAYVTILIALVIWYAGIYYGSSHSLPVL
jgi:hypothetical protein